MTLFGNINILSAASILAGSALLAGLVAWIVMLLVDRVLRKRIAGDEVRWEQMNRPVVMVAAALAVYFVAPAVEGFKPVWVDILAHAMAIVAMVGIGWLALTVTDVAGEVLSRGWDIDKQDNRRERAMLTKFRVMRRVWIALVAVCTVGAVLMTFPAIRSLGAGMLASAGVAGLVLGIALRPTLETLLASVQVALTEPISIDDVVIVEGEWGRIEEIRPTYVVVRIWDDRRLIVPLTYFISKPFQNWTRNRADITGVVTLQVDFRTPVDEVRDYLGSFIEKDEDFDGRFWNVQITEAEDRAMTLRVLCTAADASKAWNLRCRVREQLIGWMQREHPDCLPRLRAELPGSKAGGD
ncbi:MAG: mechanosensitive ion channel [Akkermansiaceae bacterium]|nr:mechanosensitive ion channel [Akkermansiaceae bacterium]